MWALMLKEPRKRKEAYLSATNFSLQVGGFPKSDRDSVLINTGIFMGFVAVVPLFLVLYVGGTALAGLEVSYFAFSKEMGPAGRTKQG